MNTKKFKMHFFVAATLGMILAGVVFAANTLNYMQPGGSRWVVGGELDLVNSGVLKQSGNAVNKCDDVTVSTAEILALNATPKTLVAAPGAGKFIAVNKIFLHYDYNSVAYNGVAAGEDLAVKYNTSAGVEILQVETTGFITATADEVRIAYPLASGAATIVYEPVANAPVVLHMLSGEVATGNSPVKVRTCYNILPSTL